MDTALDLARMLLTGTRYVRGRGDVDLDYDDPDDQQWARDALVDVISQHLRPQRTGGADWSARYVWAIDPAIARDWYAVGDELFLLWSEGDLDEPLYVYQRTVQGDDSYDLQELDTLSASDVARLLKAHSDLARGSSRLLRKPARSAAQSLVDDRRIYLDVSDLSGDDTPVSLAQFIADNSEPGVEPIDPVELARLRRLAVGQYAHLSIGGGAVRIRRVLPRSGRRSSRSRDLHDMTYQEIRAIIFPRGQHPGKLVGLRDRLTDDEIASLPSHPAWRDFPESFRSWVYEALKDL